MALRTLKPKEEPLKAYFREMKEYFDKIGIKQEDQLAGQFLGFFFVDFKFFEGMIKGLGPKRGLDIYKKLWRNFPHQWVKEARLELGIGFPSDAIELAKIMVYCQRKKYYKYDIKKSSKNSAILQATDCPFTDAASLLGMQPGSDYLKAVVKRDEDFINNVLKECNLQKKYKASLTQAIAKGNDKCEIVIKRK